MSRTIRVSEQAHAPVAPLWRSVLRLTGGLVSAIYVAAIALDAIRITQRITLPQPLASMFAMPLVYGSPVAVALIVAALFIEGSRKSGMFLPILLLFGLLAAIVAIAGLVFSIWGGLQT